MDQKCLLWFIKPGFFYKQKIIVNYFTWYSIAVIFLLVVTSYTQYNLVWCSLLLIVWLNHMQSDDKNYYSYRLHKLGTFCCMYWQVKNILGQICLKYEMYIFISSLCVQSLFKVWIMLNENYTN